MLDHQTYSLILDSDDYDTLVVDSRTVLAAADVVVASVDGRSMDSC